VVANYYKPGPATKPGEVSFRIVSPSTRDKAADYGKWYVADNVVMDYSTVTADNWSDGVQPKGGFSDIAGLKLDQAWPAMPIKQQTAEQAYTSVLESAGATLPKRDAVDTRIIEEIRNGNATYEGSTYKYKNKVADTSIVCGIIDSQLDVGGWPELKSAEAPRDSDHDGMPDEWEKKNKLNKKDPDDRNIVDSDGYTMLEKYLNSIK
jgi:pectate lyase